MTFARSALVTLVVCLVALFAAQLISATPIQTLASKPAARGEYVMSMQRCKGSKEWTNHGLWPEWGQGYRGEEFSMAKIAPILPDLEKYWPSCPEFSKTNELFWRHEWEKHGTVYAARWNSTLIEYFDKGLELLHELSPRCSPTLTGECRIKLDEKLRPLP